MQLIFHRPIAFFPYACQAQTCTYTPRRRRYNGVAKHCGTCSRSVYVAARAGFEPATLGTQGTEPTTEPLGSNSFLLRMGIEY